MNLLNDMKKVKSRSIDNKFNATIKALDYVSISQSH